MYTCTYLLAHGVQADNDGNKMRKMALSKKPNAVHICMYYIKVCAYTDMFNHIVVLQTLS